MVEKSLLAAMVFIAITVLTIFGSDILSFLASFDFVSSNANEAIIWEDIPEDIEPASAQEVKEPGSLGISSFEKVSEFLK
jgi:hypothetical protein